MTASTLHNYVESRLRELFGEPDSTLGKDSHWALRPATGAMPINVLVNGSATEAVVWVFDPYDHGKSLREVMGTIEAVDQMIRQIRERLTAAAIVARPADEA